MPINPTYITENKVYEYDFTVCTLLKDEERYAQLLESFEKFGFTAENTQFLAADNRESNHYDGYSYMRRLYPECKGKYIIFGHDDILLLDDGYHELLSVLNRLDTEFPKWMLAGGAGGEYMPLNNSKAQLAYHLSDRIVTQHRTHGEYPVRVETLDECFMVMRADRAVFNSVDLSGFHMYGPDICFQADLLGGECYVMGFHFKHNDRKRNQETVNALHQSRTVFIDKYKKYFPGRIMHTTMGRVGLHGGWRGNFLPTQPNPKKQGT